MVHGQSITQITAASAAALWLQQVLQLLMQPTALKKYITAGFSNNCNSNYNNNTDNRQCLGWDNQLEAQLWWSINPADLVLVCDRSSSVRLCLGDYTFLYTVVMICATWVYIQTHTHRQLFTGYTIGSANWANSINDKFNILYHLFIKWQFSCDTCYLTSCCKIN